MEEKTEIHVAVIREATLTIEHGVLCAALALDYGGGECQNFFCPDQFIRNCMEAAGVEDWRYMKGKAVRARSSVSRVVSIGHVIEDCWFDPVDEFERRKQYTAQDTEHRIREALVGSRLAMEMTTFDIAGLAYAAYKWLGDVAFELQNKTTSRRDVAALALGYARMMNEFIERYTKGGENNDADKT